MNIKALSLVFALSAFVVTSAQAGEDYRCIIERIHSADGEETPTLKMYRKAFIKQEFTVDRQTGIMVGSLKNSYTTKPVVIDQGSSENSFKVVTTMRLDQGIGAGSNIYSLIIKEYDEAARKPFVFLENSMVYFGGCVHF